MSVGPVVAVLGAVHAVTSACVEPPGAPGGYAIALRSRTCTGGPAAWAASAAAAGGARVVLATAIGEDTDGRVARREMVERGVRLVDGCVVAGAVTGREVHPCPADGSSPGVPLLLPGPPVPASAARAALEAVQPGDAVLVEGVTVAALGEVLEAAYERDAQIVADLTEPGLLGAGGRCPPASLRRVDIAVTDPMGAGLLAEWGGGPGSVAVVAGSAGVSWDGLIEVAPPGVAPDGLAARAAGHAFAGAFAAALASGADRPQVMAAAVAAWAERARPGDAQAPPTGG